MLTAFGKFCFTDGTELVVSRLKEVTLAQETETKEVQAFPFQPGALSTVDSAKSSETWTLTVSTGSFDDMDLAFVFDRKIQTSASGTIPEVTSVTVPSVGPYTATVSGLDAASVTATILSSDGNIPLTKGTVSATGYTAVGTTLTFDASHAGKIVAIHYMTSYTSRRVLGGTTPAVPYGSLKFFGVVNGPRLSNENGAKLYLPQVTRSSGIELAFADETSADMEFGCTTPAGWSAPYLLDLGAAAV